MSTSEQARWFAEEIQPHEASLRAYLQHSVSSRSDVDDLTQECYVRLVRERDRRGIRSSRGFLFAVARNAVRDLIRRRAVAETTVVTENVRMPVLEEEPGVVEFISRREEIELLTAAIGELPERCRHVFLLRKIQGLSQKEIAAQLGITENTVETMVARGVRRCADYLRERLAVRDFGHER